MKRSLKTLLIAVAGLIAIALFVGAIVVERANNTDVATESGRIATIGDSITFGEGVDPEQRELLSYPGQLQRMLGASVEVLNFGYIGATVVDSGDLPYETTDMYAASLESDPSIVVVMLGTNDSKKQNWDAAEYESQLDDLITLYRGLPSKPAVFLATPPAAFENSAKISPEVIGKEIVPIVRRVGEQTGAPVIDVHAATEGHPEYFVDGVHPNAEGATVIATTVRNAIGS